MKNKHLAGFVALALSVGILSSCGNGPDNQPSPNRLGASSCAFNPATTVLRLDKNSNGAYYAHLLNYNAETGNTLTSVNTVIANTYFDITGGGSAYHMTSSSALMDTVNGKGVDTVAHVLTAASITSSAGTISGTSAWGGADSFSMDDVVCMSGTGSGTVVFGVVSLEAIQTPAPKGDKK